jgi:hemolysin D
MTFAKALFFKQNSTPDAATSPGTESIQLLSSRAAADVVGGIADSNSQADSPSPPQENSATWSDSLQALLEQPPASLPQAMIAGGVMFMAVAGGWAWFGTLEEVSFAQGRLIPQGDVYRVQPSVAGEVTTILVDEGEVVEQGQPIAHLDQRLLEKELERLTHTLSANQQKLTQTRSIIQQTQLQLDTLQAIAQADVAARRSSIGQEQAMIETNRQMLEQLQIDRQAQTSRMDRLQALVDRGAFAEDQLFQMERVHPSLARLISRIGR